MDRYSVGGQRDDFYEPGSNMLVLKNKIGIASAEEMGLAETQALDAAYRWSFDEYETTTQFNLAEVQRMHRTWLGAIYDFAGEFRTVNISKGEVLFAPAAYLESSAKGFDSLLQAMTPCAEIKRDELISRIAEVHGEFLLLHPFREGNGRISRWLADLMSLQAGFGLLDWKFDETGEMGREVYFDALRQAYAGRFTSLETLVRSAIENDQM